MASRRNLKKKLNYISEVTLGACLLESATAESARQEEIQKAIIDFCAMHEDAITRISHTEPGNVKAFYKKLRADYNAQLDNVFNVLNKE